MFDQIDQEAVMAALGKLPRLQRLRVVAGWGRQQADYVSDSDHMPR